MENLSDAEKRRIKAIHAAAKTPFYTPLPDDGATERALRRYAERQEENDARLCKIGWAIFGTLVLVYAAYSWYGYFFG